jgi:hypothetical protein
VPSLTLVNLNVAYFAPSEIVCVATASAITFS